MATTFSLALGPKYLSVAAVELGALVGGLVAVRSAYLDGILCAHSRLLGLFLLFVRHGEVLLLQVLRLGEI